MTLVNYKRNAPTPIIHLAIFWGIKSFLMFILEINSFFLPLLVYLFLPAIFSCCSQYVSLSWWHETLQCTEHELTGVSQGWLWWVIISWVWRDVAEHHWLRGNILPPTSERRGKPSIYRLRGSEKKTLRISLACTSNWRAFRNCVIHLHSIWNLPFINLWHRPFCITEGLLSSRSRESSDSVMTKSVT
jgi:hypothetical protein